VSDNRSEAEIQSERLIVAKALIPELGTEWPAVLEMACRGALDTVGPGVFQVCAALRRNAHLLGPATAIRIADRIDAAVEKGEAGEEPDVKEWSRTSWHLRTLDVRTGVAAP
jgi:hypothetical protein